jgi:hypothetical protein
MRTRKRRIETILKECRSKAKKKLQPEGYAVKWNPSTEKLFDDLMELYWEELKRQLYIKVDGRSKETVSGTDIE